MSDTCVTLSKLRESGFGGVPSYDSRAPYSHGYTRGRRSWDFRVLFETVNKQLGYPSDLPNFFQGYDFFRVITGDFHPIAILKCWSDKSHQ